jgi:uncharacterized membrane protein YccC
VKLAWQAPTGDQVAYSAGVAAVAVFSYATARLLPLPEPYWAPIAAVVVLSPERGATRQAAGDRFLGTLIGSFTGWAGAAWWHEHLALYGLAVLVGVFVCGLLRLERAARICAVTTTVIILIPRALPPHLVAFHRFCEVSYGAACALLVTYLSLGVQALRRRRR